MAQTYSDPTREDDPYALPNVEVFYVDEFEAAENARLNGNGTNDFLDCVVADKPGWYWWSCFPGCLPDGDPYGPFDTEQEAITDARDTES